MTPALAVKDAMSSRLLYLSSIWPEPHSSAASARVTDLVAAFLSNGWQVHFGAECQDNLAKHALGARGVICHSVRPNEDAFDAWLREVAPAVVVFDRYTTEEKYGWRVHDVLPGSVRVLDTIDLHALRIARQNSLSQGEVRLEATWELLLRHASDVAGRELASLMRSDLTLLTSDVEMRLLVDQVGVSPKLLHLCRLACPKPSLGLTNNERRGFVMVGNFRHPPNDDSVFWLRHAIWPRIRAHDPKAEIDIYGAYPAPKHLALSDPKMGFRVRGFVEDLAAILRQSRVNLAPLRAGAGIKGKILDGWCNGLPCVTTTIGAEGMCGGERPGGALPFGGIVADDASGIAEAAVALNNEVDLWQSTVARGATLVARIYNEQETTAAVVERVSAIADNVSEARRANPMSHVFWNQTLRSTTYFSRWIQGKQRMQQELKG